MFDRIIGQDHAKKILGNLYLKKHFPPLIFVGPKGVGKRTTAINFAQIINCSEQTDLNLNKCQRCEQIGSLNHPDIKMFFPVASGFSGESDNTKILQEIGNNLEYYSINQIRPQLPSTNLIPIRLVRWLNQEMSYKPMVSPYKVIIILNVDKMNNEAANAFLKTLEEPQAETLFILTTERISTILSTIRSRGQIIRFTSIAKDLICNYLIKVKNITESEAMLASEIAEGSLRKALFFIQEKEAFLPSTELLGILDREKTSSLESLNKMIYKEYEIADIENMLSQILYIYRNALKHKMLIPLSYDNNIISKITKTLSTEQIASRISFLLDCLKSTEIYLNKKLFLFSVLTKVRF